MTGVAHDLEVRHDMKRPWAPTAVSLKPTEHADPRGSAPGDRVLVIGMAVMGTALFVLGLVLRIWMVDHRPITSDEAVNGLMSMGILHGHFGAITWGQTYGGVEPYVTSVLFALFGHSDTTLNLTPVLLSFTGSCLVYRIGCSFLPRRYAGIAALAVWVWPAIVVTNSTQELGYRFACLNLGLLAIIFAIRIRARGSSRGRWALLGLALGSSLWADPECIYFLVPCAFLVAPGVGRGWVSDRTKTAAELLSGVTGVIVGGLPFWWATLSTRAVSIAPYPGTVVMRARALVTHAAPLAIGAQLPGTGAWYGGRATGITLFVAMIVAVAVGLAWALARHKPRTVVALVAFVLAYPIIYVFLPGTWYWRDGRYIVYLPYVFIVVALYPLGLLPWRRIVAGAAALVALGAGVTTTAELSAVVPGLSWRALPHAFSVSHISLAPLARALAHHRIRLGYAGYWVAYNLDFESGGTLAFTPTDSDVVRNPSYLHQVEAASRPAWILCEPGRTSTCANMIASSAVDPPHLSWTTFTSWLHSHRIAFTAFAADGFSVIVPAVRVTPALWRREAQRPGAATIRPLRTASTSSA